jgi:acyl carrier protein
LNIATADKIKEIIKAINSRADIETLKEDALLDDQGIDSLDMLNIFLQVEEVFHIKIPDEDVDRLKTINDMVDYVATRQ